MVRLHANQILCKATGWNSHPSRGDLRCLRSGFPSIPRSASSPRFASYDTTAKTALCDEVSPAEGKDWSKTEEFFNFTRGRFLNDEPTQLAQRHQRFDLCCLAQRAADSVGAVRCASVKKFVDGMYNRAFVMTMDDGRQVVAKVPNPNAGVPHYTTASEVATMDFVRNVLKTPAPTVHAWSSRADSNGVGAEYIIMEKVPGVPISLAWDKMKLKQKATVISTLAKFQRNWLKTTFSHYGSLYYEADVDSPSNESFYMQDYQIVSDYRFHVGPASGRDWADAGVKLSQRASWSIVIGQCSSTLADKHTGSDLSQYLEAINKRELMALESLQTPKQMALFCGPSLYRPDRRRKIAALKQFSQIDRFLIPTEPSITASHLWHNDLHEDNIFVDPQNPETITGIIDWQSTQLLPLYLHHPNPAFLNYDAGEPETLDRPPYLDRSGLSDDEWKAVMDDYTKLSVFLAWRKLVKQNFPALHAAIEWRKSNAFGLQFLASRMFEYGESHFRAMLVELEDAWSDLPKVRESSPPPEFPFRFSEEEVREIEEDAEGAVNGTELVEQLKEDLGDLWPDKGLIEHERYEEAKRALRDAKAQIMERLATTDEERAEFERYWPFDG